MPKQVQPDLKVFLHLSDIHFKKKLSGESKLDLDAALRHALEQDAEKILPEIGHVDGILVSGDIAFAGKVEEYETARTWLSKLATLLGCDPGYVWCVPGNHDVDQSVHKELPTLLDTYSALRTSKILDEDLLLRLEHSENAKLLFLPLNNYNVHFGNRYDCPTSAKSIWWEDELELNDGSILRLRGLNSVIISSHKDDREAAKMILGTAQTEFFPENNVAHLTLCHHPPDWLVDGENAHEALTAHSHLQLFGHKHSHRSEVINGKLRLYSGAVHPVRTEQSWDPRYYFVALRVELQGGRRELVVQVYPRVWSKIERIFVREAGDFKGLFKVERLPLPMWQRSAATAIPVIETKPEATPSATMNSTNLNRKRLVHRFMTLPYTTQLSIMDRLHLVSEEEKVSVPDFELFSSGFQRAKEKGLLDQLWEAIESEQEKGGE